MDSLARLAPRLAAPIMLGGAGLAAYRNRPTTQNEDNSGAGLPHPVPAERGRDEDLLLRATRLATIGVTSLAGIALLEGLNRCHVSGREKLTAAAFERPDGQALITVCNHTCTLDDPFVIAAALPLSGSFRPDDARWSLCAKEYCFKSAALASFFGAGKVMPIERGAGINQRMLHEFAKKATAGGWLHIFPEGTICQSGKITGRTAVDGGLEMGRLKWGVGKLVATAAAAAGAREGARARGSGAPSEARDGAQGISQPLVVPICHVGMQQIIRQVSDTGKTKSWLPGINCDLLIRIGDPIDFSDILIRHTQAMASSGDSGSGSGSGRAAEVGAGWDSLSQVELRLFHELTSRVEEAMWALEQEAHDEYRQVYGHEPPSDETIMPAYRRPNVAKQRVPNHELLPAYLYPLEQPYVTPGTTAEQQLQTDALHRLTLAYAAAAAEDAAAVAAEQQQKKKSQKAAGRPASA